MVSFVLLVIYEYLRDQNSTTAPQYLANQDRFPKWVNLYLTFFGGVCVWSFTCMFKGPGAPLMSTAGEVLKE